MSFNYLVLQLIRDSFSETFSHATNSSRQHIHELNDDSQLVDHCIESYKDKN